MSKHAEKDFVRCKFSCKHFFWSFGHELSAFIASRNPNKFSTCQLYGKPYYLISAVSGSYMEWL